MNTSELSIIKFNVINFFSIIINSRPFYPISSTLIKLVESIISSETEPDEEIKKRLLWIYNNTHERVREHLSIVELMVYKNLDKGLNRELEINNKTFNLIDLYKFLDEVNNELSKIVVEISKKYSLEIPLTNFAQSNKINIEL